MLFAAVPVPCSTFGCCISDTSSVFISLTGLLIGRDPCELLGKNVRCRTQLTLGKLEQKATCIKKRPGRLTMTSRSFKALVSGTAKEVCLAVFAKIMRWRGLTPHLEKPCTACQQARLDVNMEARRGKIELQHRIAWRMHTAPKSCCRDHGMLIVLRPLESK